MSRVIIAGSRQFPSLGLTKYSDYKSVKKRKSRDQLRLIIEESIRESKFYIRELVSGTCWGLDQMAEIWAMYNNIPIKKFPADWDKYGGSAGFRRNGEMAEYADALICIHTGSNGSKDMVDKMKKAGKPVYERIVK